LLNVISMVVGVAATAARQEPLGDKTAAVRLDDDSFDVSVPLTV